MRWVASVLLCMVCLAGCAGPVDEPAASVAPDWATIETAAHVPASFPTLSLGGGPIDVAGYAWLPEDPVDSVVLLVHGFYGMATTVWGPSVVPGYSMVHRILDSGRAVVVIDRPSYGGTDAPPETQTHEDHAWVVSQVAGLLRDGGYDLDGGAGPSFDSVTGIGHSYGGRTVMMAEGLHGGFDAIASVGWSHGGFPVEFQSCQNGSATCDGTVMDLFLHRDNMDPRVEAAFDNLTLEDTPPYIGAAALATMGCWGCLHEALVPLHPAPDVEDMAAAGVQVPVMLLLGAEDRVVEASTQADEEAVFANADDVTVTHLADTGHMVWHHRSHEEAFTTVLEWLDERNL